MWVGAYLLSKNLLILQCSFFMSVFLGQWILLKLFVQWKSVIDESNLDILFFGISQKYFKILEYNIYILAFGKRKIRLNK